MKKKYPASRAIRVVDHTYEMLRHLKAKFEQKIESRCTYSEYLDQLNNVADLLINGKEVYEVNGVIYDDQAEAWGQAVLSMAKGKPTKPNIFLQIGPDDTFEVAT